MRSHVELFAGIGACGIASAKLGYTVAACVEQDPFCQSVLRARYPDAHIFADVREVGAAQLGIGMGLLSGGFPCQDLSLAGKGAGLSGARSGMWFEFLRIIGECRPHMVLIENVAVLKSRGLDTVVRGLAENGYACWWDCAPALSVGAPHLRDRIWLAAVPRADMPRLPMTKSVPPGSKMPRAGACYSGRVYALEPRATVKTAKDAMGAVKLADGTTWLTALDSPLWPTATRRDWKSGAASAATHARNSRPLSEVVARVEREGMRVWATPRRSDGERGGRGDLIQQVRGNKTGSTHGGQRLWPTPERSDGTGGRISASLGGVRPSGAKRAITLGTAVAHEGRLWPTPSARTAAQGPGRSEQCEGGPNLRTAVADASPGPLNPAWVEWLMGLPVGWTDPDCAAPVQRDWLSEHGLPRVARDVPQRKQRLMACGNALVWHVAHEQLRYAHELLGR